MTGFLLRENDEPKIRVPQDQSAHTTLGRLGHGNNRLAIASIIVTLGLTFSAFPAAAKASYSPPPSHEGGHGLIAATNRLDPSGSANQIITLWPDGSHLRVLTPATDNDREPDSSPDGKWIAFTRCVGNGNCDEFGAVNIWLMRVDGSDFHEITNCDGSNCYGSDTPTFSPDGRWIAIDRDQLDPSGVNHQGIFLIRPDGSGLRRGTENGADNPPDLHPHFSPDGDSLVFDREQPDGTRHIRTVRTDGTHLNTLFEGKDGYAPNWSPVSNTLVTALLTKDSTGAGSYNIATERADGTHEKQLTIQPSGVSSAVRPEFSLNGHQIAYITRDKVGCTLWIMNANGSGKHLVPINDGCTGHPSWVWVRSH